MEVSQSAIRSPFSLRYANALGVSPQQPRLAGSELTIGTATFSSIIINGFGFNVRQTMLLQIPTGLFSWAGSLILSYIAAKTQQRTLTALGGAFLPLIGTIMLHTIPRSNRAASMVGLYIVYLYWAPYVLMNAQHVANSAGGTKKIVSYGVV